MRGSGRSIDECEGYVHTRAIVVLERGAKFTVEGLVEKAGFSLCVAGILEPVLTIMDAHGIASMHIQRADNGFVGKVLLPALRNFHGEDSLFEVPCHREDVPERFGKFERLMLDVSVRLLH